MLSPPSEDDVPHKEGPNVNVDLEGNQPDILGQPAWRVFLEESGTDQGYQNTIARLSSALVDIWLTAMNIAQQLEKAKKELEAARDENARTEVARPKRGR